MKKSKPTKKKQGKEINIDDYAGKAEGRGDIPMTATEAQIGYEEVLKAKKKHIKNKILGRVKIGWKPFGLRVVLNEDLDYFVRKGWLYVYKK